MRIKTIIAVALSTAIFVSCTDTSYIDAELENLKNQVAQLQQQCSTLNTSLETLDQTLAALKNRDFVTSVNPLQSADGKITGYVITFVNQPTITIWLPEEKQEVTPPSEVHVPVISVKMDQDGQYYWTCDGEFIKDASGNKIPTGADGMTPKLKVEDQKWYVSYNGGSTWEYLADVPEQEINGYVFSSVDTSDPTKVVITLADGQKITLPTAYESLISVSVESPDVAHNPGDVITVSYTALKNVTVVVDDSDVEASEVIENDAKSGTIRIQTRSGVSLNKQRAFIIFSLDGAADADWRLLSFDSSMKARISDIK
jgi:hypothetical protein